MHLNDLEIVVDVFFVQNEVDGRLTVFAALRVGLGTPSVSVSDQEDQSFNQLIQSSFDQSWFEHSEWPCV